MPYLDGFEVMKQIKPLIPDGSYLPVLILTGDISQESKQQALSMGAKDFLTKPLNYTEVLLRIKNMLETRFLHIRLENQNQILEDKVHERTQELVIARKQVEAERTRLADILDQLPVGVLIAEGEPAKHTMRWTFINQVGQAQLAMPTANASVLPESFTPYPPSNQPHREDELLLRRILWTGQAVPEQEMVIRHDDGEERVFLVTSTLLREESGTREAALILQDITERKHLEQQKDDFIALASHELRTPLTVIKGYTQLALKSATESKQVQLARKLGTIDDKIDHITQLANTLLDVSKLQSGAIHLDKKQFDLGSLVQRVANDLEVTAPGFTISVQVPSEPATVNADPLRIEQALANLMNNAIKYSAESRSVEISVTVKGDEVVISVRDFGVGIPDRKQARVFERFFQAGDISSHQSGLGLGLFISRNVVTSHEGRMWFESSESTGSTFYISLPLIRIDIEQGYEIQTRLSHI